MNGLGGKVQVNEFAPWLFYAETIYRNTLQKFVEIYHASFPKCVQKGS